MPAGRTVRAVVLLAIVAIAGVSLLVGESLGPQKTATSNGTTTLTQTQTMTSVATQSSTSTLTTFSTVTSTVQHTSVLTSTQTITTTTTRPVGNPDISYITLENVTVTSSPMAVAFNPATRMIYVSDAVSGTTVINGSTPYFVSPPTTVATDGADSIQVDPVTNLVYVGSDVVNGSTNQVVSHLNYTIAAVNPTTDTLFALALQNSGGSGGSVGDSSLVIIDGKTDSAVGQVPISGLAFLAAVNPVTGLVYAAVCTQFSVCTPAYVYVIDPNTQKVVSQVAIDEPFAIAVNPQTNVVYVTTAQNDLVSINGTTNVVMADTPLSAYALSCSSIAINPGDNLVYLSCAGYASIGLGTFTIVDGTNNNILNSFVMKSSPEGVAYDPVDNAVYLAEDGGYVLVLLTSLVVYP